MYLIESAVSLPCINRAQMTQQTSPRVSIPALSSLFCFLGQYWKQNSKPLLLFSIRKLSIRKMKKSSHALCSKKIFKLPTVIWTIENIMQDIFSPLYWSVHNIKRVNQGHYLAWKFVYYSQDIILPFIFHPHINTLLCTKICLFSLNCMPLNTHTHTHTQCYS